MPSGGVIVPSTVKVCSSALFGSYPVAVVLSHTTTAVEIDLSSVTIRTFDGRAISANAVPFLTPASSACGTLTSFGLPVVNSFVITIVFASGFFGVTVSPLSVTARLLEKPYSLVKVITALYVLLKAASLTIGDQLTGTSPSVPSLTLTAAYASSALPPYGASTINSTVLVKSS